MLRRVVPLLFLLLGCHQSAPEQEEHSPAGGQQEVLQTETFTFEVDGNNLVGLLDRPTKRDPVSTILLVHGYGKTNVVEQNWFYDLRSLFAGLGINVLVWDKPGCGKSEGTFDIDQPVASSAEEVIAAARALQERGIRGTEKIGLWGISRAGWIAPLAMAAEPAIDFWISVSGTDDKENGRYLLASNFPIEGRSAEETEMLISEWQRSFDTAWQEGSYQDYLDASPNLREDPFMELMGWGGTQSEEAFYEYQDKFKTGEFVVDEEAGLMVYVPEFARLLSSINRPVLALFGEKDTNVDWRSTAELYRKTLGSNPNADLTIKAFPNANHILKQCETGGVREMRNQPWDTPYAEGYFETMTTWLVAHGFGTT